MKTNYEINIKPSEITQSLINKIEEIYLQYAYKNNIDKYTWNRPVGTTIKVDEIFEYLNKELEKEKREFEEFEYNLYKKERGNNIDINQLYNELNYDYLTIDNKKISFYSNPCYGAYVDGLNYPDVHLKIKFICSNGNFYVYLENEEWYGRGSELEEKILKKWNKMITDIYYNWFINDIPVHVPYKQRPKIKKRLNNSK